MAVALNPGIQNLVTAKNTLLVPDPEGPLEDGLDHWQEATRRSLESTGLKLICGRLLGYHVQYGEAHWGQPSKEVPCPRFVDESRGDAMKNMLESPKYDDLPGINRRTPASLPGELKSVIGEARFHHASDYLQLKNLENLAPGSYLKARVQKPTAARAMKRLQLRGRPT